MKYFFTGLVVCFMLLSCSNYYYIVRHAEKAAQGQNMSSDVPLTEGGEQRAVALKEVLKSKHIKSIYSTSTIRTKSTAQPTADFFGLSINIYGPQPDSAFINLLNSKKENVLIVGHSNTVDDIVNMLCGELKIAGDLKDHQYDNLFIVKKKGRKFFYIPRKFGALSD